jgi:hypothetical protein
MRMLYEPVDHPGLEVTVLLRELSRPNLPIVTPMGDPHTTGYLRIPLRLLDFRVYGKGP